jgi:hypothetical protein
MLELDFRVATAEVDHTAATPQINFKLQVSVRDTLGHVDARIAGGILRAMIRIEPTRRQYAPDSRERLRDLFGADDLWGKSVRGLVWTTASIVLPSFERETAIDVPAPCSFDFNIAATKYFAALDDGEVPLTFLFSGTIFYTSFDGRPQVAPIAWDKEAGYRLPVAVWRETIDRFYPNAAWLCLERNLFDRLLNYKTQQKCPTWEQAIRSLLQAAEAVTP